MKSSFCFFGTLVLASLTAGCACNHPRSNAATAGFPRLRNAGEQVVVCYSNVVGDVGNAQVMINKYQTLGSKDLEWAVALFVVDWVYLRPQELTPLIAGIDRLIEVPVEVEGYDRVTPRYVTRDGNLRIGRGKQPPPLVGYRYDLNDWSTDLAGLQKFKGLLVEARAKLQEIR
jgi:hypothetical protein